MKKLTFAIKIALAALVSVTIFLPNAIANGNSKDSNNRADANLKSAARVNPSTLAMEFSFPLAGYPGRVGNTIPVGLSYSSKLWKMTPGLTWYSFSPSGWPIIHTQINPDFAERSASGWTSSLLPPHLVEKLELYDEFGGNITRQFSEGALSALYENNQNLLEVCTRTCVHSFLGICYEWSAPHCIDIGGCGAEEWCGGGSGGGGQWEPPPTPLPFYVKRVWVQLPDGSSHEFRKDDSFHPYCPDPLNTTRCGGNYGEDKSGVFLSTDGSGMTLIRQTSFEGQTRDILKLANGAFYVFANSGPGNINGSYHPAEKFVDQNGNLQVYDPANKTWTDTLGNPHADILPSNWISQEQTVGKQYVNLPGIGTSTLDYEITWTKLEDSFSPELPLADRTLSYWTNRLCAGSNTPLTSSGNDILFSQAEVRTTLCNPVDGNGNPVRFNPVVMTQLQLPNEQSYYFKYNRFGEITTIKYPSGGIERFEYGAVAPLSGTGSVTYDQTNRGVKARFIYDSDANLLQKWTYSDAHSWSGGQTSSYTVTTRGPKSGDPYANVLISERSVIAAIPGDDLYGYNDPLAGMVRDEKTFDENGAVRARTLTDWIVKGPTGNQYLSTAKRDARIKRSVTISFEPGSTTALATYSETEYDESGSTDPEFFSHLNVKRKKAYNYAAVTAANVDDEALSWSTIESWFPSSKVETVSEMDYQYDPNYKSRGILGLPTETRLYDTQNGNELIALSQASYDEVGQYYSMIDYGSTTSYVAPTGSYAHLRGKPTTKRTWDFDINAWITTHTQFDNYGNVRKVWDTSGDQTRFIEYEYDPQYKYAYVTKTTAPAPDPTGIHGMNTSSEVSQTYDFNTGLSLTVTDANGQTATTEYDGMLRPIRITPPSGGAISESEYNDSERWVKSRQQIDSVNWAESTTYFDTLGRPFKTKTKDLQGDVYSLTEYDNLGRVSRSSNPYREGETVYWSKPRYDAAGRVVETFAPAISGQTGASTGTVQFGIVNETGLLGAFQITTDASGRKRRVISGYDGLLRVDEPTAIGGTVTQDLGDITNPNQPTSYSYNTKGELTKTTQGKSGVSGQPFQNRYFKYDSFGRLIRVRQPEQTPNSAMATTGNPDNNQWTAAYSYDVFGNVIAMTDAKNTTITTEYDKAGRTVKRTYSDGTPQAEFFYDGKGLASAPAFSRGSITMATNGVSEDRFTEFDNHGRLKASQQLIDGQTYDFLYKYNLSGGLTEQTYPSGRVVRNYTDQDGGLNVVTTKAANGLNKVVASNFDYTAAGGIKQMRLGNGLWETTQVNERMQLTQVGLGTTTTNNSLFKVDYEYGEISSDHATVDTARNVGMIARATTTIPTTSFVQTYKYDAIARLTEAKEKTGSTTNWQQAFGYDIFGNRTSLSQSINGTLIPNTNVNHPTIDPANNRFTTGQGYVYDLNGNLIQDAEGRSFAFDGNDKQTEVRNASNQIIGQYYYDASGARVKKVTNTETTVFVYDAGGALAAEYSTQIETANPQESYLTTDHLGSPRVITDKSGNVISRRDFMPFGEELSAGVGTRSTMLKYAASGTDGVRKRFTGYEKDSETDLDFAEARMYQNKHGRFTAPDPLLASASPANPQTFNRYTYTGNNPVNLTDPIGLDWCQKNGSQEVEYQKEAGCTEGWYTRNGQVDTIGGGDWSGYGVKRGDVVRFIAGGTLKPLDPSKSEDAYDYAQATGTVIAGAAEVMRRANAIITSSVGRSSTLPSSSTAEESSFIPCNKLIENCSALSSSGTLDISNNEGSKVVEGSIRILETCGIGFAPCAIGAAIGRFGQGEFGSAGGNLLGAIPGFLLVRRAGTAVRVAEEIAEDAYVVYQGINPATKAVEYVGMTMRDVGIRQAEHWLDPKKAHLVFEQVKGASNLTKMEARIWEQNLINKYRLPRNGGQLLNKINSIAEKYWPQYGITP